MIFIINYLIIDAWSACSIATNDHACILIWDAHTRMGHNIGPYAYGISHTRMHGTYHTRMGQHTHMGQNIATPYLRTMVQNIAERCHSGCFPASACLPPSAIIYCSLRPHVLIKITG